MSDYTLDNYLYSAEAYSFLGIGRSRFESLIKKNLIKYHICPTSKRKIFHMEELNRFLKNFKEIGNVGGI